jgi:hypothetical protein
VNSGDYIFNTEGHLFPLTIDFHNTANISLDLDKHFEKEEDDHTDEEENKESGSTIDFIVYEESDNIDETKKKSKESFNTTPSKISKNKCVWTFLDSLFSEDFPLFDDDDDDEVVFESNSL